MKYHLNFIGTGYALENMQALVRSLDLEDHVTFHGVINDREELRRYYAGSNLFLFPSFYDNAPLVVREAAAMQTPTILLEGSTAAEPITDRVNGFLTSRTPEAYAQVIQNLSTDPQTLAYVGVNARKTLARPWHDVIDEVINRYDEIIARHEHTGHKQ